MLQNLLYPCKVKTIKMKALLILACSLLTVGAMAQTTEPAKEKKEKKEKIAKVKKPPIEFKTLVIEKNDIPYGEDV
jgi:Flp pilus assembly protein CpaB